MGIWHAYIVWVRVNELVRLEDLPKLKDMIDEDTIMTHTLHSAAMLFCLLQQHSDLQLQQSLVMCMDNMDISSYILSQR